MIFNLRARTSFILVPLLFFSMSVAHGEELVYHVAPFEADITIPIGHACMGGGVADATEIVDPLYAKGFVLLGTEKPIVFVVLDWCQVNNDSFERWRDILAESAGTSPQRVMLSTVHQHDAPICDLTAQKMLDEYGMKGANCDAEFHETAVQRTAAAIREAIKSPRQVTHIGLGQAEVDRVACNRRVVSPEGHISWNRGSASGDIYGAPVGEIDPLVKTISLWDGDTPVLAWHTYAVHPMSYYGNGSVSADFVGMARDRLQKETPEVFQIYVTGCAGDTTVGKWNEGAPKENRPILADRLYQGMRAAWDATKTRPLGPIEFRCAELLLPPRDEGIFTIYAMKRILADEKESRWSRVSAALGLSWRKRIETPIDVPCLSFADGAAMHVILPSEAFVGYQLTAQKLAPESFVAVAGFGDGVLGYVPTDQCWKDGYDDHYCWVAPMTERLIVAAMAEAMGVAVTDTE